MARPSVIAIGAGVQDVLLLGNIFRGHREDGGLMQEFKLGSKNEIDQVIYSTGGGATNAAVTFARQGLRSAFMGHLGRDIAGRAVLDDLHKEKVGTGLVKYSEKYGTGYSTIMLAPNGERTVLVYRGASEHFEIRTADFHNATCDWFYVSSLSGNFDALRAILSYANRHGIKVAINPGKGELSRSHDFRELLQYISILSVNKEEAAQLFRGKSAHELLLHAAQHVPIVMITDGPRGSISTDGTNMYMAGMYKDVPVVDRLGAGDAFSSGFVSQLALGQDMELAVTFASANSTSVVSQVGAKTGILPADTKLHKMPIVVRPLHKS